MKKKFKVFYCLTKLTPVASRKREISIAYANGDNVTNHDNWIHRKRHVIYERYQTKEEMKQAEGASRCFSVYSYFVDFKPWYGNLEKVLGHNFRAERNHVSKEEREKIRTLLRDEYYKFYNLKPKPVGQTELNFDDD